MILLDLPARDVRIEAFTAADVAALRPALQAWLLTAGERKAVAVWISDAGTEALIFYTES